MHSCCTARRRDERNSAFNISKMKGFRLVTSGRMKNNRENCPNFAVSFPNVNINERNAKPGKITNVATRCTIISRWNTGKNDREKFRDRYNKRIMREPRSSIKTYDISIIVNLATIRKHRDILFATQRARLSYKTAPIAIIDRIYEINSSRPRSLNVQNDKIRSVLKYGLIGYLITKRNYQWSTIVQLSVESVFPRNEFRY